LSRIAAKVGVYHVETIPALERVVNETGRGVWGRKVRR
jgi:hypothetical protein